MTGQEYIEQNQKYKFIAIPVDVWEAVNTKKGFIDMYYGFRGLGDSPEDSFNNSLQRVQVFFPDWVNYNSWASFVVVKNREIRNRNKNKNNV